VLHALPILYTLITVVKIVNYHHHHHHHHQIHGLDPTGVFRSYIWYDQLFVGLLRLLYLRGWYCEAYLGTT